MSYDFMGYPRFRTKKIENHRFYFSEREALLRPAPTGKQLSHIFQFAAETKRAGFQGGFKIRKIKEFRKSFDIREFLLFPVKSLWMKILEPQ